MKTVKIAVLAGDGIGPEVMGETLRVLRAVQRKCDFNSEIVEAPVGGSAYDMCKEHLPQSTIDACRGADAILFGSVGGPVSDAHLPKWSNCEAGSILKLRKTFGFSANFRPATVYSSLRGLCPLKDEVLGPTGVDLLIVRELQGDSYFGEHKRWTEDGIRRAHDVAEYDEKQIASVTHAAFKVARDRKGHLTSVDKANVLDISKLWREVVHEVHREYSDVPLTDMLVDNCALQLVKNPRQFDVIVTSNLFGDILSDLAAVLPGSLGLTPSASVNSDGFGLYEPSGGSAPDIAGQGIANPIAQILSLAMLLRISCQLDAAAKIIELSVDRTLQQNVRTKDIWETGSTLVGTFAMTDAIIREIERA